MIEDRFETLITLLSNEELQTIEIALLEIANHGQTNITFNKELCFLIDDILNY